MAHAISSVWQRRTPQAGRRSGFQADRPNQNWVTDITAINTDEGTLYLAAIEDLFSRKVVAWAIDTHMETSLVTRALNLKNAAAARLRPACGPPAACGVARSSKWREPFHRIVRLAAGPHLRFQGSKWVARKDS